MYSITVNEYHFVTMQLIYEVRETDHFIIFRFPFNTLYSTPYRGWWKS